MKKTLVFTKTPFLYENPDKLKFSVNGGYLLKSKATLPVLKTLGASDANLVKVETLSINVRI